MGMTIFEQSGIFDPTRYGLGIGSVLHVIVVGGGESGGSSSSVDSGSNPGSNSSFGTFITALGGRYNGNTCMGYGGFGEQNSSGNSFGGGGGGGYLPGVPIYGGNGGSGSPYDSLPAGLGGAGGGITALRDIRLSTSSSNVTTGTMPLVTGTVSSYANLRVASIGTHTKDRYYDMSGLREINTTSGTGACGNGYGAGGGGWGYKWSTTADSAGKGGNSGELKIGEIVLANANTIPVTVGLGGSKHEYYNQSTIKAIGLSGSNGVVIVCW